MRYFKLPSKKQLTEIQHNLVDQMFIRQLNYWGNFPVITYEGWECPCGFDFRELTIILDKSFNIWGVFDNIDRLIDLHYGENVNPTKINNVYYVYTFNFNNWHNDEGSTIIFFDQDLNILNNGHIFPRVTPSLETGKDGFAYLVLTDDTGQGCEITNTGTIKCDYDKFGW
jgi:hypothetical protein